MDALRVFIFDADGHGWDTSFWGDNYQEIFLSGEIVDRSTSAAMLSPYVDQTPLTWDLDNFGWDASTWASAAVLLRDSWSSEGSLATGIIMRGEMHDAWSSYGSLSFSEFEPVHIDDYLKMVPWQHQRPKFLALLRSILQDGIEAQNFAYNMPRRYDVDSAIGAQLDQIGEWIGISRHLSTPLEGVYFAWDTEDVGWENGVWRGLNDPADGLTILPDETYRILIKIKIVANQWNGSKEEAVRIWSEAFDGMSKLAIEDHQDMSMSLIFFGVRQDKIIIEIARQGLIPLKPAGVRIKNVFADPPDAPVFAWDVDRKSVV